MWSPEYNLAEETLRGLKHSSIVYKLHTGVYHNVQSHYHFHYHRYI